MVTVNRRTKSRVAQIVDDATVKQKHELFIATLMSRMIPLGQKITIFLVPVGYDISKNRRVKFQKRENTITGEMEIFIPRESLEKVIVHQSAVLDGRKYYLVFPDTAIPHTRIVWGRYCTSPESKELVAVSYTKK